MQSNLTNSAHQIFYLQNNPFSPKQSSSKALINPCTNPQQWDTASENICEVIEIPNKNIPKWIVNAEPAKYQKWVKFEDEVIANMVIEENLKEVK